MPAASVTASVAAAVAAVDSAAVVARGGSTTAIVIALGSTMALVVHDLHRPRFHAARISQRGGGLNNTRASLRAKHAPRAGNCPCRALSSRWWVRPQDSALGARGAARS
eukprot:7408950-Alexandrium_andersonii.AAC.1